MGHAVASGRAERGIIVCGSGAGVSVAACKIRGVRAATIHDTYTAHQGVEHDDVNVLCLGGRVIGVEVAAEIVAAFLARAVSDEERHVRRRAKVDEIERTGGDIDVARRLRRARWPTRIFIVRHGETEWSANGKHTSVTDLPLTDTGREQAAGRAPTLAGRAFALVLCSPLLRARETCELAGFGDVAEICEDLVEWDYGDYEGLTTPQIRSATIPAGTCGATAARAASRPRGRAPRRPRARALRGASTVTALAFAHGHILRVLDRALARDGGRRRRALQAGHGGDRRARPRAQTPTFDRWSA